jgi:hypothetical protein
MPRSGPFRILVFQPPVLYYAGPSTHAGLIMSQIPCRRGNLFLALVLFIQCVRAPAAFAGDDRARPRVQRLTLFKNGLGFIVSAITLPDNARTVRVGPLPVPTFGTFWVGYPDGVRVQSLLTSMEDVEWNVRAQTVGQLVEANAGRHVTVHTADRDFEGTVLPPALPAEFPLAPDPYVMSPRGYRSSPPRCRTGTCIHGR